MIGYNESVKRPRSGEPPLYTFIYIYIKFHVYRKYECKQHRQCIYILCSKETQDEQKSNQCFDYVVNPNRDLV